MNSTEDEIIGKYANQCLQCTRNTLLTYENEWTCVACGYNVVKRKKK